MNGVQKALLFLVEHNERILLASVGAIVAGTLLLLFRSVSRPADGELQPSAGGRAGAVNSDSMKRALVDLDSLESTLRKVLETQTIQVARVDGPAGGGAQASGGLEAVSGAAPDDRDARIQSLLQEVEALRGQVKVAGSAAPAAGAGGDNADLMKQLEDLKARLSEYEIIEDDIADLTHFKEENARLTKENEELRIKALQSGARPATGGGGEKPAESPTNEITSDSVPLVRDEGRTDLKFEPAEKFGLDANDSALTEFASALESQEAPVPATDFKISVEESQIAAAAEPEASVDQANDPASVASVESLGGADKAAEPAAPAAPASAAPPAESTQDEIDRLLAGAASEEPGLADPGAPERTEAPASLTVEAPDLPPLVSSPTAPLPAAEAPEPPPRPETPSPSSAAEAVPEPNSEEMDDLLAEFQERPKK
jgi:hypothetical protein